MKRKTAVLIYDQFCNFEISVALATLAWHDKKIDVFAKTPAGVTSEEGLRVLPDKTIAELEADAYDSLLLPGAADLRSAVEDDAVIDFIRQFDGKIIGAISIAPILLVKAGMLSGRPFMIGADREGLLAEGYRPEELERMLDWNACIEHPPAEGYLVSDKIVTSVSFNFVKFGLQFSRMLGIDISPESFGI